MAEPVRKFSDFLNENTSINVPPWDSYQELCEEFGDDFMNFPEFEYRFYRFHNGEKDDFDSSTETRKTTFSDLPMEVVGQFVKRLRPIERVILRLVSPNLASIVDSYSPKLKSRHVEFTMEENTCQIYFGTGTIELKRLEDGYQIEDFRNTQTLVLRNSDYREGISNAFLTLLGHPKTRIGMLKMDIDSSVDDWFWFTASIEHSKICAKKLVFDGRNEARLLPFLELMKPGALRSLTIYRSHEIRYGGHAELAETEQWRQAKRVEIRTFEQNRPLKPDQLKYFAHFNWFDVKLCSLTEAALMEFVKTLKNSKNFQKCILQGQCDFPAHVYAAASNRMLQSRNALREPIEGTPDRELELRFCHAKDANLIIQRKKKRTIKN